MFYWSFEFRSESTGRYWRSQFAFSQRGKTGVYMQYTSQFFQKSEHCPDTKWQAK